MGYRSDVTALIYGDQRDPDKYEVLKVLMNTAFKGVRTEFEANMNWHDEECVLEFKMEGVKWYDSCLDVQDFTRMLCALSEIEGFNYEVLRVGEDDNDIQSDTGGNAREHLLSVERTIQVNL